MTKKFWTEEMLMAINLSVVQLPTFCESFQQLVDDQHAIQTLGQEDEKSLPDCPQKCLSESQIIFVRVLTKTTDVSTEELKIALGDSYKLSRSPNALRTQKCRIYSYIKKNPQKVADQLKARDFSDSEIDIIKRAVNVTGILTEEQILFVKALTVTTETSSEKFKEALGDKYKSEKSKGALRTQKCRIYSYIKKNPQKVADQLKANDFSDSEIDIIKRAVTVTGILTEEQILFVKALTVTTEVGSEKFKEALGDKYKSEKSKSALRSRKCRIYNYIKKNPQKVVDQLKANDFSDSEIDIIKRAVNFTKLPIQTEPLTKEIPFSTGGKEDFEMPDDNVAEFEFTEEEISLLGVKDIGKC